MYSVKGSLLDLAIYAWLMGDEDMYALCFLLMDMPEDEYHYPYRARLKG